ncbi:PAS domain S-box protein [Paenibacillus oryzisoli]|uniref:histidine kinase n=1 Tax=Paenibacillus oryzisoli TaxID=1850517 RepID=A0A198AB60_9BACL|nr:PAS domain S-box protein [Paenibacillus oryzisoli]OAS18729.1 PAS domain-containing sensor histidine kinase [Paenibacillus oryzisoli]
MSIKVKLTFWISVLVAFILLLNMSIYYISTKEGLKKAAEQQMITMAEQISATVEVSQQARQYIEDAIGERLRSVAIFAEHELDPDIENVTNEQLIQLSAKLGVDHITLWKRLDNDIVALRSSDPQEINLSSKTWDYWYTAFNQLFDFHQVSIPQGQKLNNYWSGPINYATSSPNIVNKWGNYYDGTTNYMINPYVNAQNILDFQKTTGTDAVITNMLLKNSNILEVTGIDPQFFGKMPIIKIKKGQPVFNLDVRDIIFGTYKYTDETNDVTLIQDALTTKKTVTTEIRIMNQPVIQSLIPILNTAKPFVIRIIFNAKALQDILRYQLIKLVIISLSLLILTMVTGYLLSGLLIRPIRQILSVVNQVAKGKFEGIIKYNGKDELGHLAFQVNLMTSNLSDYTKQLHEVADELRHTKGYLESFVNHTSDAIHVTDLEGNVTQLNQAFERIFGWAPEELYGKKMENIPPECLADYQEIIARILRNEAVADYETIRYTKDGRIIDVSITISTIWDENGQIVAIASITRNITARKEAEDVLRRSEKLNVIGQLAAGVAHEIRNPLTTIKGFVQLQKSNVVIKESQLDLILSELDRINFIVSEFLVLAKPQAVQFQRADIREILLHVGKLLESQASLDNVEIEMHLDSVNDPYILCDRNQLKQVFINVMKNAMEAMPGGGTIKIELDSSSPSFVLIHILDQGFGLSEEELCQVGEPFYTNKENGNGLGLMVTRRIINNHKGTFAIKSKLGEGTCIEIELPK